MPAHNLSEVVDPTAVCMAHVLAGNVNMFLFPEEFAFVMRTQILPRFEDAARSMSSGGKGSGACQDWTTLYRSMLNYLLASYRSVLQVGLRWFSWEYVMTAMIRPKPCGCPRRCTT